MPLEPSQMHGRSRYKCTVCQESFQLDRFVPFLTAVQPQYCPLCKGDLEKSPISYNRWQDFAIAGGLPPEQGEIVEDLYKMWSPKDGDPISFIDYIRQFAQALSE